MNVYEICKVSPFRTVEIREWGPDFHEEVAVVSKATVFEQSLLHFVSSCLVELGYKGDGEMEIRKSTSKKPAIRAYRLVLLAKKPLSKTRLSEIKSQAKAILSGVSQGQSDWVDHKIDSIGPECESLPQKQEQEIANLKQAFQKKYEKSKVPNTSIEFDDNGKKDTICVSRINLNPHVASDDMDLEISEAVVIGLNRSEEKLQVMTQEGELLELQFYCTRASETFFGTVLANMEVSNALVKKTINHGNGKAEHHIRTAKITLPTGETLTLKS